MSSGEARRRVLEKKRFPSTYLWFFSQQWQHDFRLPRLAHTRTLFHLIPTLSSRLHASCPAGLASAGKPFGCHPPTRTAFHSGVYSVLSFDLEKTDRFKKWSTRMCADHVKNFDQKGIWLKILEFPIISSSIVCFQYEDVRGTADIITDSSSSPQGWMLTQFCFWIPTIQPPNPWHQRLGLHCPGSKLKLSFGKGVI